MHKKNLLKFLYIIIILIGFLFLINYFYLKLNKSKINPAPFSTEVSAENLPTRLYIPEINVDAPIQQVGLTSDGKMDSPDLPDVIGWFNAGTMPGNVGSAVMAGHFGWKDNIPAVFDDLHKLKIGDYLYVENENKELITFVVRDMKTFNKDEDASKVFYSNDSSVYLNLITCSGIWNSTNQSREDRLVVFTERITNM